MIAPETVRAGLQRRSRQLERTEPTAVTTVPIRGQDAAARLVEMRRLQAIRKLAHKMNAAELWLSRLQLADFVRAQKASGKELERRLVLPLLDPADHAYLTSANVGTIFAPRPRIRIPLITAFGYRMGAAFHSYLHIGDDDRERCGRLCALFNLFIAMFDRVCDTRQADFSSLVTILDEPTLRRLPGDVAALADLGRAATGADSPELRAVLAVFVAFYAQAQEFARIRRAEPCWRRLNDRLIEAYRAEIVTVSRQRQHMPIPDLQAAAQRKSVLPFQIMLGVARLGGNDASAAHDLRAECVAQRIGMAFSLTDDLMDLSRDHRSGDVNTLLLDQMLAPTDDGRHTSRNRAPNPIASESRLDEAADAIVTHLAASIKLAGSSSSAMDQNGFRDMLVGYTQNWLGAADHHLAERTAIA
jgi:hypothetical protein